MLFGATNLPDGIPAVCLLGAEYIALAELNGRRPTQPIFELDPDGSRLSIKSRAKDMGFHIIPAFNDHKKTSKKVVVAFLDEYIAELEGK